MDNTFLVWNSQGAASSAFRRALNSFTQGYRPDLVVLVEPKVSGDRTDKVIKLM